MRMFLFIAFRGLINPNPLSIVVFENYGNNHFFCKYHCVLPSSSAMDKHEVAKNLATFDASSIGSSGADVLRTGETTDCVDASGRNNAEAHILQLPPELNSSSLASDLVESLVFCIHEQ